MFSLPAPAVAIPPIATYANRASINLAWSPSPSTNTAGYFVQYGNSPTLFNNSAGVGLVTNVTIKGLSEGRTYYFRCVAVNAEGLESLPSNTLTNFFYSKLDQSAYTYRYQTSVRPGSTNLVQESGDGVTFTNSQTIVVGTNGALSFLRTNLGGNRFVRVMTK